MRSDRAIDLVGPADPGELSPESAAWISAAPDAAVGAGRDGTPSVLVRALGTLTDAEPPEVVRDMAMVRGRGDSGRTRATAGGAPDRHHRR